MKTITTSYDALRGQEFDVSIHEHGKRRKTLRLNRTEVIEVTQQWLEGLKKTKSAYNKSLKKG